MKFLIKLSLFLGLMLIIQFHATAQKKNFKSNFGLPGKDYFEGVLYVKIKPSENATYLRSGSVNKLGDLDLISMEPLRKAGSSNARRRPSRIDNLYILKYDKNIPLKEALYKVYQSPNVEIAEPSLIYTSSYTPNDPRVAEQYYLNNIRAFEAWDISQGNSSVVV